jgi:hydroxyacylglutathione hydrolase
MTFPVAPVVDDGLGNTTWLVDLGAGRALVVDASRDLRAVRAAASVRGLRVAFAADTHLHADFVTGAVDLAAGGARLLASAAGRRRYPHTGLADGDEVDLGGLTLRALATPGHTGEHLSFLLLDGELPLGVFTGGSLIVGSAARTDLVHPDRTEQLAREQWRSLRRLATLPDEVAVWPTHGAGSFCSAPPGAERSSTIGREKVSNALLNAGGEDAFVTGLLAGVGAYPAYFRGLGEVNRRGPRPVPTPPVLAALTAGRVSAALDGGAVVIDVRSVEAFAAAHIPAALSISLREVFATWLGWTTDSTTPLVFIRDAGQDPAEIVWQALKIGHEQLMGELDGGMASWQAAGLPTAATPLVSAAELRDRTVIDVRQRAEFTAGHLPQASNAELGQLADSAGPALPAVPVGAAVMCGHGERAMTAASLLARAGRGDVAVVVGGPEDWARATGRPLSTSS